MAFLWPNTSSLGQVPGRQQRYIGIPEVLLDPFVLGVGTDLSVLFGDKDDCRQVAVEGPSVSHHHFPWHYFLMMLQAAGVRTVQRRRTFFAGGPGLGLANMYRAPIICQALRGAKSMRKPQSQPLEYLPV